MQIYKTTDYGQFKTIEGNRDILPRHVKSLIKSISLHNRLEQHPISVNDEMEVIDGQHRLAAAEALGVPIHYTIKTGDGLTQVQGLQVQRSWTLRDYLESYASLGDTDYLLLKQFVDYHNAPISMSVILLMGFGHGDKPKEMFKNGEFQVLKLGEATAVIEMANLFLPVVVMPSMVRLGSFLQAIKQLIDAGVSPKRMKQKIAMWKGVIYPQPSSREYLRIIEDIYNWKQRQRVRLYN